MQFFSTLMEKTKFSYIHAIQILKCHDLNDTEKILSLHLDEPCRNIDTEFTIGL